MSILIKQINIDDNLAEVKKVLGKDIKQSNEKDGSQDFVVVEYLSNKLKPGERFVVSLNQKLDKVVSKFWSPGYEGELLKLDKLKADKFSSLKFESIEPPLCTDSPSSEIFIVNPDSGLIIRYTRSRREVVAVLWSSPEQYKIVLNKITKCPGK